jgi:hypothetical protein
MCVCLFDVGLIMLLKSQVFHLLLFLFFVVAGVDGEDGSNNVDDEGG